MTIEERASEYATAYKEASCDSDYILAKSVGMKIGYVAGAKEQREIDIEIMCSHFRCALNNILHYPNKDKDIDELIEMIKEKVNH